MHDYPGVDDDEAWPSNADTRRPDASEFFRSRHGTMGGAYPCPQCQSTQTEPRHIARRIGGAVGAAAGVTSGVAVTLSGAEIGAAVGLMGGPIGLACCGIADAILAGLVAGAAGCATGAACGQAIDHMVLDNRRCLACGRTFTI
ncbi:hypothetical protein [Ralstonia pseudosolanacearum]|uniref:hypothetical protein n=1 Tax=Ralstonia pseudosolanacearum TaxID=1310165 RepID=UPI001ADE27EB|nr:hypothetical protein [Ralstonia pseudosolanacearum]QWF61541.1 hypothetical protein KM864_02755 [Ralstonia solanacearum]